jgi:hypothetical protein
VSKEDVACYRLYAANCVELAERVSDGDRRLFLLRMAQAWGRLANQVEKNVPNNADAASVSEASADEASANEPAVDQSYAPRATGANG